MRLTLIHSTDGNTRRCLSSHKSFLPCTAAGLMPKFTFFRPSWREYKWQLCDSYLQSTMKYKNYTKSFPAWKSWKEIQELQYFLVLWGLAQVSSFYIQRATKKDLIYKVGPGVLSRHNSRDKNLQTWMNSPEARRTTVHRKYGRVAGRDSRMASNRAKKDKDRWGELRCSYTRGPESPSKPPWITLHCLGS